MPTLNKLNNSTENWINPYVRLLALFICNLFLNSIFKHAPISLTYAIVKWKKATIISTTISEIELNIQVVYFEILKIANVPS